MRTPHRGRRVEQLSSCADTLVSEHDLVAIDLDGVLYLGADAVPGAAECVRRLQADGVSAAYVTNNASRTPAAVAATLAGLDMAVDEDDVVTSAQAAATLVAAMVPGGANVLVVGGAGLDEAVTQAGLRAVGTLSDDPAAVVQGYGPDVGWPQLAEASYAVAAGLPWIATNTDRTLPTERGVAPGNGTLVSAVAEASGSTPQVAGKPETPLFDETFARFGARRPLVVGDRLDTDIEGANRVDADSLLVLTGVSDLAAVAAAGPASRPTFLAPDLAGLFVPHPPVQRPAEPRGPAEGGWECGPWRVTVGSGARLEVAPDRTAAGPAEAVALLRAVTSAAWDVARAGSSVHEPADTPDLTAVAGRW